MHREDYYRECKKNDGVTELILAKNRLGPTGTVRVTFIPEEETFIE
jgi:replicative DNA helicase